MQTNVQIDAKNLRPSPEHRPRGKGARPTVEVIFFFKLFLYYIIVQKNHFGQSPKHFLIKKKTFKGVF